MKITEQQTIDAPPEIIWPYVADPVLMSGWNGKMVDVQRSATESVTLGETFAVTFRMMGNRDDHHDIEVVTCEPPRVVAYRHAMVWKGKARTALARYDLTPRGSQTQVTQTMDLSGAGIPWFFRLLIKCINRFGESQGPDHLEKLEAMIAEDTRGEG